MMTVSRRLLLMLLPTLALLMLAGGVLDYLVAGASTRNAYDRALASSGLALAAYLRLEAGHVVFAAPAAAPNLTAAFNSQLYSIIGPDGAVIGGNATLPRPTNVGAGPPLFSDATWQQQRLRIATLVTISAAGPITISVAETLQQRLHTERVMLFGKLVVDFAELDVMLLLIWIAVYFGLRPLRRLHDQVESQTLRELQSFNEAEVPGEVRPLVRSFNHLLQLLSDAAASQRRFVADAAHQLRTPVAGLLAQLELLCQHPAAAPIGAELDRLNGGISRLSHSANQLLALARAEPLSMQPEQFRDVALQPLIEELVARQIDRADRLGLDLGVELQPIVVHGDAWMLEDLIGNLLDNALKYTPLAGRVTVRCGLVAAAPYVEVEDNGPGIPETERLRVRERFYRRPGSVGNGCGLGLAIVEEIARVHGAQLSIESGALGMGTRMRVQFAAARL